MGSKKRSAWRSQRRRNSLHPSAAWMICSPANARSQRHDEARGRASPQILRAQEPPRQPLRSRGSPPAECAEHSAPPYVYHCPYCNGWRLTSKGNRAAGTARSFAGFHQLSPKGEDAAVIPFFGQRGRLSVWRVSSYWTMAPAAAAPKAMLAMMARGTRSHCLGQLLALFRASLVDVLHVVGVGQARRRRAPTEARRRACRTIPPSTKDEIEGVLPDDVKTRGGKRFHRETRKTRRDHRRDDRNQ